jgi:hypothetical protein
LGKVECIGVQGLRFWFNSNDHLPPHFHVTKSGEWEIRVYFLRCARENLSFDQKWGERPSRRVLAAILELVLQIARPCWKNGK